MDLYVTSDVLQDYLFQRLWIFRHDCVKKTVRMKQVKGHYESIINSVW